MNSHPSLNYESAVSTYLENLTTMLRGFRSGASLPFLETWVPDEDPCESIVQIFKAAQEADLAKLTVVVGPQTCSESLSNALRAALANLGSVEITSESADTSFTVSFDANKHKALHQPAALKTKNTTKSKKDTIKGSYPGKSNQSRVTASLKSAEATDGKNGKRNPHTIHQVYRSQIDTFSKQNKYAQNLVAEENLLLITSSYDKTLKLMILIDEKQHLIEKARYAGASTALETALLEVLCPIIEGKPILEASDHAVIELEYRLRDHSLPPPVKGVLMPENCDSIFHVPLALVRGLLSEYKTKTGYDCLENFYMRPGADRWQELANQERRAEIKAAIVSFSPETTIQLVDLEGDRRVVVQIDQKLSGATVGHQLMLLERYLQQKLEPTLQVHLPAKADLNTIREIKRVTS